jgi:peptidoglycan/xylan/chitin deacetylase (PgdA/CDA1 family)
MTIFLVYHRVTGARRDPYTVPPDVLESHLETIRAAGVRLLDPLELDAGLAGIVLCFDDGTVDHSETVAPILERAGVRAIFYVPTAKVGREGYLKPEQLRRLHEAGHVIGAHGHTHDRLDVMPRPRMRQELATCSETIRALIGVPPVHLAPPGGFSSAWVVEEARQAGFLFVRTMRWGYNRTWDPTGLEAVPVTARWGDLVVRLCAAGMGNGLLKFAYVLKHAVRCLVSEPAYGRLRRVVAGGR